ncbi:MAG: thiamine phosphate synthase [Nitrospiria bacterium]
MKLNPHLKICLITPPCIGNPDQFYPRVEEALSHGIRFVQFRNKQLPRKTSYQVAIRLRDLCKYYQSLFIIDDEVDLALASNSDGVHIGQEDYPLDLTRRLMGPDKIIGVSTHSPQQAIEAERGGADYIGFGSIFPTLSKKTPFVAGLEDLKRISGMVNIPVFAIGGISPANVSSVLRSGGSGIAVISSIWDEPFIGQAVGKFNQVIQDVTHS